jgi:hypothetical protein
MQVIFTHKVQQSASTAWDTPNTNRREAWP